jgi:hypothetical protein
MPLENLTANHIGANGKHEPQRSNNGLLYITPPTLKRDGIDTNLLQSEEIKLAIQSFPVPKRTMGVIEMGYLNEKRKFAGIPTYDDLSLVFHDYVDTNIAEILWAWSYAVHDPRNGKTGLASQYKASGWFSLFSPEGSIERRYDVIGIWPSAIDPGEIDHEGEDTVRITMTLSIDKVMIQNPFTVTGV